MRLKRSVGSRTADVVIYAFLTLLALIMVFPFYNMLLLSFANYEHVAAG